MPMTKNAGKSPPGNSVGAPLWKDRPIKSLSHSTLTNHAREWYGTAEKRLREGIKGVPQKPTGHWKNPNENGSKIGGDLFNDRTPGCHVMTGSKSKARKAASAAIAKIPFPLARHIAQYWMPQ